MQGNSAAATNHITRRQPQLVRQYGGDSWLDPGEPEARDHAMSVEANVGSVDYLGDRFTFIDLPGSIEFAQDARAVLPLCDAAVVVCEADARKVPALQMILRELEEMRLPRFLFLNKIDLATATLGDTLALLQPASRTPLLLRQLPIWQNGVATGFIDLALERGFLYREHAPSTVVPMPTAEAPAGRQARYSMLEKLADYDDELMEELLGDIEPPRDQIFDDLAKELFAILDSPAPDPSGVSRPTAALSANPDPLDPEPVLVGDGCGETSTAWVAGAKVPNGAGWVALGSTAGWIGAVDAMVELPDGRLVVAGRGLSRAAGVSVQGLAIRSPRTGKWSALATLRRADGSAGSASTLAVDAVRGLLYVGGDFASVTSGGVSTKARAIARFDISTKRWSALGGGLAPRKGVPIDVRSLAIDATSGRLVVGGSFARAGTAVSANVAVWRPAALTGAANNSTKGEWRALAGGLSATVETVAISPDGTVHAAGHFVGGVVAKYAEGDGMWRIDGDAATFADAPRVLAIDSGGGAIAGTGIAWYGAALASESASAPGGWVPLGGGISYPRRTAWVSSAAPLADGRLAIGGYFSAAGGTAALHLAIWDPSAGTFSTVGSGLAIEPDALAASSRATLYAATRVRGDAPGSTGGRCIAAFAPPAPLAPAGASVVAGSRSATVRWGDPISGTIPEGWIAVATANGNAARSCSAAGTVRTCVIKGLSPGARYSIALRAWVAPAGPSPTITIGSVVAQK